MLHFRGGMKHSFGLSLILTITFIIVDYTTLIIILGN